MVDDFDGDFAGAGLEGISGSKSLSFGLAAQNRIGVGESAFIFRGQDAVKTGARWQSNCGRAKVTEVAGELPKEEPRRNEFQRGYQWRQCFIWPQLP